VLLKGSFFVQLISIPLIQFSRYETWLAMPQKAVYFSFMLEMAKKKTLKKEWAHLFFKLHSLFPSTTIHKSTSLQQHFQKAARLIIFVEDPSRL
jgi:hypothetical protein